MQLFPYELPLHGSPLPLSIRKGFLLRTDVGWGEIAPLPGWSRETMQEAIDDLSDAKTPSVQFGLACAQRPLPLAFPRIRLNALATNLAETKRAIENGFRTIKIKVGALSPEEAAALISQVQSPSLSLRIDINRKWNVDQVKHLMQLIDLTGIEYFEEPVHPPDAIDELPSLPIALDETLVEEQAEELAARNHVVALILKPTLLGNQIHSWIQHRKKKKMIFSSSFESAVGLLHIAHLQKQFAPEEAAGLDTYRYFTHNFFFIPSEGEFLLDQPLEHAWINEFAH